MLVVVLLLLLQRRARSPRCAERVTLYNELDSARTVQAHTEGVWRIRDDGSRQVRKRAVLPQLVRLAVTL